MSINEKYSDNENYTEISESSSLTNKKNIKSAKSISYGNNNTQLIICCIIIIILLIIFFLFFKSKFSSSSNPSITDYYSINITKYEKKEMEIKNLYSDKWVVITSDKTPDLFLSTLLNITKGVWKIVIVERGENNDNKEWDNYIGNNDVVYLSLKDQENLCYQTTKYIDTNSYQRKNIGYLYAIEHGAKEIFDADDDICYDNLISTNLTNRLLYYANNISHMINPFQYFGRSDIWPRGFRLKDLNKNNSNSFYKTKEELLLSKPLIFNGLLKIPDVDTIFLQTKEDINTQNKKIKFYKSSPLFYIPGNYAPINSKNTIFLYEVFPSLALPVSVSRRVCDIWRGYLIQRYAWGYKGTAIYQMTGSSHKGNFSNMSINFDMEKDLFFKIDKLLSSLNYDFDEKSIKYPGLFVIKLIEILIENNILNENDLNMYKAFLYDLESFGYKYNLDYKIKINSDNKLYVNDIPEFQFYIPSIPNIEIQKKIDQDIILLNHYDIKTKFNDILLIINYNYEFLTSLNDFIINLYEDYFPNIIFITPGNYSNDTNKIIPCPESHKGYYSYYCMKKVYEKYPSYKGYIFVMDDAYIKVWELINLNFDIPWILTFCYVKTKIWLKSSDREELLLSRNKKWKNNLKIFFNGDVIGHGISDFFYLPNYFLPDFIEVAEEFYKYEVFLEQAVPSIYGIILKPLYQYIDFTGLWNDDRKNWKNYLYTAHKQIIVHPIKFSDVENRKEIIKYNKFKNARDY